MRHDGRRFRQLGLNAPWLWLCPIGINTTTLSCLTLRTAERGVASPCLELRWDGGQTEAGHYIVLPELLPTNEEHSYNQTGTANVIGKQPTRADGDISDYCLGDLFI